MESRCFDNDGSVTSVAGYDFPGGRSPCSSQQVTVTAVKQGEREMQTQSFPREWVARTRERKFSSLEEEGFVRLLEQTQRKTVTIGRGPIPPGIDERLSQTTQADSVRKSKESHRAIDTMGPR